MAPEGGGECKFQYESMTLSQPDSKQGVCELSWGQAQETACGPFTPGRIRGEDTDPQQPPENATWGGGGTLPWVLTLLDKHTFVKIGSWDGCLARGRSKVKFEEVM